MITPRDKLFYREFLDNPAFPSDGTIPRTRACGSRAWASRGSRRGRQAGRPGQRGDFLARIPGLNLAGTRSTDGIRGQTLYRDSTFNGFG